MSQWMQCSFVGHRITWADSNCSVIYAGETPMKRKHQLLRKRRREESDVIAFVSAFLAIDKDSE